MDSFLEGSQKQRGISDNVDLFALLAVLHKRKKWIVLIAALSVVVSVIMCLNLPNTYRAQVTIMPLEAGSAGLGSLLSGLGGLPLLGNFGEGQTAGPNMRLLAIFNSHSLAARFIEKHGYKKILFEDRYLNGSGELKKGAKEPSMQAAVGALFGSYIKFVEDKKAGTILIIGEMNDPKLSTDLANKYIVEAEKYLSENSFTKAKKNRLFLEKQLVENKRNLLFVGKELNEFYRGNKVSNVESRVDVPLDMDSEYQFVSSAASSVSHDEAQGADLEFVKSKLDNIAIARDIPQQVYLQYLTLRRELLGKLNVLLAQQYEMAKIDEMKEDLSFQIIDRAEVPESRFKPNRRKIVITSLLLSVFFSICLVFLLEYIEKQKITVKNRP